MKKTPLFEKHIALNARIIDFYGWTMPVSYTGVIEEHKAARNIAALFDTCHMGEIEVKGPQAFDLLQLALTRNLQNQEVGQIKLATMLTDEGGIIDDLTVYKIAGDFYMLVTNATTKLRDWQRLNDLRSAHGFDCSVDEISEKMGKLDLQGPCAQEILQKLTNFDLDNLAYYHFIELKVLGKPIIISRSGYTGEDGFEIYAPSSVISNIWDRLLKAGTSFGLKPAGLGARDTLRLESGMMLNGQDMTEDISPLEVPYGWVVDWDKDFTGKAALLARKTSGIRRKLAGFVLTGRGIARQGHKVTNGEREIGLVTSGTFSPTLNKSIGLAFIDVEFSKPETAINLAIRDSLVSATTVKLPFYKRSK